MNKTIVAVMLLSLALFACAEEYKTVCLVYFTGVGCPHCAQTDPFVFGDMMSEYNKSLVVIEYEIYQQQRNAPILLKYGDNRGIGYGVPNVVVEVGTHFEGDRDIKGRLANVINEKAGLGTHCVLINSSKPFEELDLNALPGEPKIWYANKMLYRADATPNASNTLLRELLQTPNIAEEAEKYTPTEPMDTPISGGVIKFEKAMEVDGWVLQWNERKNNAERMEYSLEHYIDWFPYLALALGGLVLIFIYILEKKETK